MHEIELIGWPVNNTIFLYAIFVDLQKAWIWNFVYE